MPLNGHYLSYMITALDQYVPIPEIQRACCVDQLIPLPKSGQSQLVESCKIG
jgi:hypothetical protein